MAKKVRADFYLVDPKVGGTALAHIPRVNILQEIQRDHPMTHLPQQVGQKDRQRYCYARPEPTVPQMTTSAGKHQTGQQSREKKANGVLRL